MCCSCDAAKFWARTVVQMCGWTTVLHVKTKERKSWYNCMFSKSTFFPLFFRKNEKGMEICQTVHAFWLLFIGFNENVFLIFGFVLKNWKYEKYKSSSANKLHPKIDNNCFVVYDLKWIHYLEITESECADRSL